MAVISLIREHQLSIDEVTRRVNKVASKLEQKLGISSEWDNEKTMFFRRKGANGSIEISEHSVEVTVRLGIMFKALKGVVQQELEQVLDKQFNI
ncbi:polyhydroxyalkanoic acid system family protein [Aliikangiella sp. G2MR2-5]|uniref:polyhydroxyalkanoic acid system family protein n=1 Tax=Aliikangiella sp. G2MR2-5 TaxID=2788943 RepID=UPI0018ABE21E|nr:polyhydroxyalkanoic acid system family protein [Aliikangiella sp. G2MR2-5]